MDVVALLLLSLVSVCCELSEQIGVDRIASRRMSNDFGMRQRLSIEVLTGSIVEDDTRLRLVLHETDELKRNLYSHGRIGHLLSSTMMGVSTRSVLLGVTTVDKQHSRNN